VTRFVPLRRTSSARWLDEYFKGPVTSSANQGLALCLMASRVMTKLPLRMASYTFILPGAASPMGRSTRSRARLWRISSNSPKSQFVKIYDQYGIHANRPRVEIRPLSVSIQSFTPAQLQPPRLRLRKHQRIHRRSHPTRPGLLRSHLREHRQ